jgi:hypothetical protein
MPKGEEVRVIGDEHTPLEEGISWFTVDLYEDRGMRRTKLILNIFIAFR